MLGSACTHIVNSQRRHEEKGNKSSRIYFSHNERHRYRNGRSGDGDEVQEEKITIRVSDALNPLIERDWSRTMAKACRIEAVCRGAYAT